MRMVAFVAMTLSLVLAVARADEEKVDLDKVPKAVLEAVKARFPEAKLVGAEKETEDGKTIFEINIKDKNQNVDVSLTAEGKILEIEKQIAAKDWPKPVSQALEAKYPKATYKVIEEVNYVKDGKEKLEYYEAHLVTAQGKSIEVRVAAGGKILEEEDQSNEKKEEKKKEK
jgi:hypothetical protein